MLTERNELDNVRSHTIGKPFGTPRLPDKTKLAILQQKQLQLVSQSMIAKQFNVSRKTVNQLSVDDLSPEYKDQLYSFTDKLSDIRDETANLLLEKLRSKSIKDGVLPTLLNIANQNYRLETNQSTANINIADCAQIAKQAFEIQAKLAQADHTQTVLTQAEKIAIYEEICLAQGQQPDVSLLELDADQDGNLPLKEGESSL